jgi:hypothetical protein
VGYITVYLLEATKEQLMDAAVHRSLELIAREGNAPRNGLRADISMEVTYLTHGKVPVEEVCTNIDWDVVEFYGNKAEAAQASLFGQDRNAGVLTATYADSELIANPHKAIMLEPRNHQLVMLGKGRGEEICKLEIGVDFSLGCIANTTPSGLYVPEHKCSYCYAYASNVPSIDTLLVVDPSNLRGLLEQKLEGVPKGQVVHIRLGQLAEMNFPKAFRELTGAPYNLKRGLRVLAELAKERAIRVVMPTKVFEFDREIISLFRKANVTVLASIAYEELEPGMVAWGFGCESRLEGALRLADAGVNAHLYVVTDVTRGFDSMHPDAHRAMEFYEKHKDVLGLQWLDLRLFKKWLAPIQAGAPWDQLIFHHTAGMFREPGRWYRTGQKRLAALAVHPDFKDMIRESGGKVRGCFTHQRPGYSLERDGRGVRLVRDPKSKKSDKMCGSCFTDLVPE